MCDLLAISAGFNYTPRQYLPLFAEKGKRNLEGWGIGFFREGEVLLEKSLESVYQEDQMHESFQRLARVIDSRMILAHLSCPLIGGRHRQPSHPCTLHFLGHPWLFVHVGIVPEVDGYQTELVPRLTADIPSARIFEFLRDRMVRLCAEDPYLELFRAVSAATAQLVARYPGHYSYFLANESLLFAYFNFRQLMMFKEQETLGNILLLTTVEEGLSDQQWRRIELEPTRRGKLVVISGADFVYQATL
jgi:predicted glutamine amidotransferase